ncbi:MAG: glycosyltransferase [Verrucomicrobia bacterium]|nr:glycosyltransferase [Verrucomicrobiota bacterium]
MKISGFTFVRNAVRLDLPVVEAITSVLPVCDEFIVAAGDSDDATTDLVRAIGDPRIRIIETVWDPQHFVRGAIYAQQTNVALAECTGDWCFYIQADEAVHEDDLPRVKQCMEQNLDRPEVEGLLFRFLHFWGDYEHYHRAHNWYDREIRIVRNRVGVESWHDAQGFRRHGQKLKVVNAGASVYHYGHVRHPEIVAQKQTVMDAVYRTQLNGANHRPPFDYTPLERVPRFTGTHPRVMRERIASKNWDAADYRGSGNPKQHKHDRLSQRLLTFVENNLLGGHRIWTRRNYVLIH